MKKDQLTCTDKGTRKTAIRKTHFYPSIPNPPLIRNIREALEYIFIQYKSKLFLEKEIKHWKEAYEISRDTRGIMESTMKLKDDTIEALKMGDMAPDTFVELTNNLERQRATNRALEKEIKQLKTELKRSKKFHYQDFILN